MSVNNGVISLVNDVMDIPLTGVAIDRVTKFKLL